MLRARLDRPAVPTTAFDYSASLFGKRRRLCGMAASSRPCEASQDSHGHAEPWPCEASQDSHGHAEPWPCEASQDSHGHAEPWPCHTPATATEIQRVLGAPGLPHFRLTALIDPGYRPPDPRFSLRAPAGEDAHDISHLLVRHFHRG